MEVSASTTELAASAGVVQGRSMATTSCGSSNGSSRRQVNGEAANPCSSANLRGCSVTGTLHRGSELADVALRIREVAVAVAAEVPLRLVDLATARPDRRPSVNQRGHVEGQFD